MAASQPGKGGNFALESSDTVKWGVSLLSYLSIEVEYPYELPMEKKRVIANLALLMVNAPCLLMKL